MKSRAAKKPPATGRPKGKTVHVRGHCRRKGTLVRAWERTQQQAKTWGF